MNLLVNKKVHHSYEILDTFEAGLKLTGSEVKSLRQKHGSLKESYVLVDTDVYLVGCHLPPFQPGHTLYENIDTYRKRKLLLHKKQIQRLRDQSKQKGLSVVPLRIYTKGNLIKIEIGIGRGKKLYDKRSDMKKKTAKRDADRAMKNIY